MKNPANYIRQQLIALLDETITYDSIDVPCYSGNGEVTKYQILLKDLTRPQDLDNRDSFAGRWEQQIEVISEQVDNVRKHVNNIGEEVMEILRPTPRTTGIASNADFQIGSVKSGSPTYIDEQSGEGTFINRLILRVSFLITQK